MEHTKQYLKAGAVCSLLSALTTAILMYGPNAPASAHFDSVQALHSNALYLYKPWILFFHPQFHLIAALCAATLLFRRAPFLTGLGILYLGIWTLNEMMQQAYIIDALNQIWRPAYLAAEGAEKIQWRTIIEGHSGISDTLYFLLIFGFGLGSFLLGFAFMHYGKLAKYIGMSTSLIGAMSLLAFIYYYAGATALSPIINGWYDWIYGPLQIAVRAGLALWLWQQAVNNMHTKTTI